MMQTDAKALMEAYLKTNGKEVVAVVRCKDCTWFDYPRVCLRHGRFVENSNWFCADGERRDNER